MTKQKIQGEIAELKALLADPEASALSKELAQEELSELEAKLAQPDNDTPPADARKPAKKRGRPAVAPKRAKKEHPAYDGPALDAAGNTIQKGDTVTYTTKGGEIHHATVISLKRHQGGGHQIKYKDADGKTKTPMVQPSQIVLSGQKMPELHTHEKIPAAVIDTAHTSGRKDCDENEVVLVKPNKKVKLNAPMIADPEKGDVIVTNKKGHPMYVATGEAVKKDYKKTGPATPNAIDGKVKSFIDGEVETPEQAAAASDTDDKRKYGAVKAAKPAKGCTGTQEKAKSPALMLFLEGMRMKWHSGQNLDKITRVLYDADRKKLVVEIDSYNAVDWNIGYRYYDICPESGRMTKISSEEVKGASTLMGKAAMKEFYRHPYGNSCGRVSKALYVECYRNGTCDTERKKRLYGIFAGKCSKEISLGKEYTKFLHHKAAAQWKGPKSGESYAEVFRRVAKEARLGK